MNLLFAVGLLAIGVIIIVALVFVIRSEPASEESVSIPPPALTKQEAAEDRSSQSPSPAQVPLTPDLNAPVPSGKQLVSDGHQPATGQFYELKNELESLHGQAQELEYRIRILVDMVERVEQTQNSHFPIEGKATDSAGTQTTR